MRKRLIVRRSPTLAEGAVRDPEPPPLHDAVQYYGPTKLGRLIGADPEEVRRWYRHRKPVPEPFSKLIEDLVQ